MYQVIGPCKHYFPTFLVPVANLSGYVHGFWDGESLLGPMPSPWILKLIKDRAGIDVPRFFNSETGEESHEDPRLMTIPIPSGWKQQLDVDRTRDDPFTVKWFKNEETGERMNSDPRMTGKKLTERGIQIQSFMLG